METRREFLIGAVGAAALIAAGGAGRALAAETELLRPPGGQDEQSFFALCSRCYRCRTVCPEDIVVTATIEDGVLQARTPKLDFHRGYCTFCNKCIDVCPTGALVPFDSSSERIGMAVIDKNECLAYIRGACDKCVDACIYGAITLNGKGLPVVDESACNGCGICEYACPSASYGSYGGTKTRGINVLKGEGHA